MKSALELSQQFEKTFNLYFGKHKSAVGNSEQAMQLAVIELCSGMARSMTESQIFHDSQLGFKQREIENLQKQIERQKKMLQDAEADKEMLRKQLQNARSPK